MSFDSALPTLNLRLETSLGEICVNRLLNLLLPSMTVALDLSLNNNSSAADSTIVARNVLLYLGARHRTS